MEQAEFENLLSRIRDGDQQAARSCVEYFEPELRRVARVRLRDPRLQSIADSMDVTQSVFGDFFRNCLKEDVRLASADQLLSLLVTMTKNRVIDLARKHKRIEGNEARTQPAREVTQLGDLDAVLNVAGPSSVVASKDLAEYIRTKMSVDEFAILERRNLGLSWDHVADELGKTSEALRKQLARAIERVRSEFDAKNA